MSNATIRSSEVASVGPLRMKLLNAGRTSGLPDAIATIRHRHHSALCARDPLVKRLAIDGNETFDLLPWHAIPVSSLFTLQSCPRGSDFVFEKTSHVRCQRLCAYDQFDQYQLGKLPAAFGDSFLFAGLRRSEGMVAALPEVKMQRVPSALDETPEEVTFEPMCFRNVPTERQMFFVDGNQQSPLPHSALYLRDADGVFRVGTYADYVNKFSADRIASSKTTAYEKTPDAIVTVLVEKTSS